MADDEKQLQPEIPANFDPNPAEEPETWKIKILDEDVPEEHYPRGADGEVVTGPFDAYSEHELPREVARAIVCKAYAERIG